MICEFTKMTIKINQNQHWKCLQWDYRPNCSTSSSWNQHVLTCPTFFNEMIQLMVQLYYKYSITEKENERTLVASLVTGQEKLLI